MYLTPQFLYFLAASAALPDEVPAEGLRLIDWYLSQRVYLFGALGAAIILDTADTVYSNWDWYMENPDFLWGFFLPLVFLVISSVLVMAWTRRVWVHWIALAALLGTAQVGYSGWQIKAPAAVQAKTVGVP